MCASMKRLDIMTNATLNSMYVSCCIGAAYQILYTIYIIVDDNKNNNDDGIVVFAC